MCIEICVYLKFLLEIINVVEAKSIGVQSDLVFVKFHYVSMGRIDLSFDMFLSLFGMYNTPHFERFRRGHTDRRTILF